MVANKNARRARKQGAPIYGDLLCERVGVSLRDAVIRKFNATSQERGSDVRLPKQ